MMVIRNQFLRFHSLYSTTAAALATTTTALVICDSASRKLAAHMFLPGAMNRQNLKKDKPPGWPCSWRRGGA